MVTDTREANRLAVMAELLATGPIRRAELAASTELSGATVSRMVESLIADGFVREVAHTPQGSRGRPAALLEAVAQRTNVAGVDLGASTTRIVVADGVCNSLGARSVPTPGNLDAAGIAAWLGEQIAAAGEAAGVSLDRAALGLPGAVNVRTHSVSNAPNMVVIESPGFYDALSEAVGLPLEIDNDANYALLGEQRFGAARDAPTAVMLTIGAGLGAGISIEGRLLRGRYGLVGEFGQLPVGALGTPLENMVTGPAILRRAAELGISLESPADLFAPSDDRPTRKLRQSFEEALLIVLAAAVVSCEPEVIVLGGGISQSLRPDLPALQAALHETLGAGPSLRVSVLGQYSGAIGAAVAALHTFYRDFGIAESDLSRIPRPRELEAMD